MITSKEVTALRKAGKLDEAYAHSLDLIAAPDADDWDRAAHGWCLIDLVKRHASDGDRAALAEWLRRLDAFEAPAENDVLASGKEKALALGRTDRREALKAQSLSKQGRHEEAARIYADLHAQGALQPQDRKSWGWELYRLAKAELQGGNADDFSPSAVQRVKRYLNTYLKLNLKGADTLREGNEFQQHRPQRVARGISFSSMMNSTASSDHLHSLMLHLALRLAKGDHLKALPFLRLWNPDRLTEEDFASQTGSDGKSYSSLAERAIQAAAAEAIEGDRPDDLLFILPHVEAALKRFPENIWLKLHLVKLLRGLHRTDEARALAIEFAREKANEYWVWDLIADLSPDNSALQLSCYAKALLCSQDEDFVGKVRLKLAAHVADCNPAEARFEVERVISHRTQAGYRIPPEAKAMSESAWFAAASPGPRAGISTPASPNRPRRCCSRICPGRTPRSAMFFSWKARTGRSRAAAVSMFGSNQSRSNSVCRTHTPMFEAWPKGRLCSCNTRRPERSQGGRRSTASNPVQRGPPWTRFLSGLG